MRILLVHQNFPGQYRHLAATLRRFPGAEVIALGDARNLANVPAPAGIRRLTYSLARQPSGQVHPYLRQVESAVLRGQAVARACQQLRRRGFVPDLVCAHAAWGEALYLRDIFPDSRLLGYFEYYYQAIGADIGFDPEFPSTLDDRLRVRTWNMVHQSTYFAVDQAMTPTHWQASTFPAEMQGRMSVVHEGIDTERLRPDPAAVVELPGGLRLDRNAAVVTFVSRGLEPYRGFHIFMRALPALLERLPQAQVVIVGRDAPSYGRKPSDAEHWRAKMLAELGGRLDLARVHFVGTLPYETFCQLMQVSRAHVYLTYPFVLSWSMLEAMALGAPVIGSRTAPVTEVIAHEQNGLLVDFFDGQGLVDAVERLVADGELQQRLGAAGRDHVVQHYDLRNRCLPALAKLLQRVAEGAPPAAPPIPPTPPWMEGVALPRA